MPTFDVVSEVDMQEVRNAFDQAVREVNTRYDFKDTGSTIDLAGQELQLHSSSEDRMKALVQVIEEKFVKRQISLKALEHGKVGPAAKGTVRQTLTIKAGIDQDHARRLNKFLKDLGLLEALSTNRGNGIAAMARKIRELAALQRAA